MPERETIWVHEDDYGSFAVGEILVGLFQIVAAVVVFFYTWLRRGKGRHRAE